jgi:Raf kinase inhibitor-like YbhB/YbcL family protein
MKFLVMLLTPLGRALRGRRAAEEHSVRRAPELAAPRSIVLTSTAFAAGGTIPDRHCTLDLGPNVSPELSWTGVPAEARQLLLVIEDIDVPSRRPGIHTAALFAPTIAGFAEGTLTPDNPEVRYLPTRFGRTGYSGPRPFPGHGVHHYGFHVYALDAVLPPERPISALADVLPLVAGHVLASGFLEGVKRG